MNHEKEWEDLTEKEILIGILTELQQIRLTLQDAEPQESITRYSCQKCGWEGSKEDRRNHLDKHNAPQAMLDELFTQTTE